MKHYDKLVRDRIPDLMAMDNITAEFRIAHSDKEYEKYLYAKLDEEVKEFQKSHEIEELADIEEVIRAILRYKKITIDEFQALRSKKARHKGKFKQRIIMEVADL